MTSDEHIHDMHDPEDEGASEPSADAGDTIGGESSKVARLSGMYEDWFLDYASYVILERAVPEIRDGLKPVQRRILHAMKELDDGRYNKVANIIGHTMKYHPHGDASIGDALVQLGQKDLLIDTQGNWGNILTGDSAAAPRYIEARPRSLPLTSCITPKRPSGRPVMTDATKSRATCPSNFPFCLPRAWKALPLDWHQRYCRTTSMN